MKYVRTAEIQHNELEMHRKRFEEIRSKINARGVEYYRVPGRRKVAILGEKEQVDLVYDLLFG